LVDFAGPDARSRISLTALFHASWHLKDNAESRVLALLNRAGFVRSEKVKAATLFFGLLRIDYYRAASTAPGES
jgi:hypothetical protein